MQYYARCFRMFLMACLLALAAHDVRAETDAKAAMKNDKTGTNPVNFTHDVRLYNEYQFLKDGDGWQNVTTLEFRTPFADGKWQFRMRGRYQWLHIDEDEDAGIPEIDENGFGDFDFRFLTVPIVDMKRRFALAVGFETFLPSATEVTLGSGASSNTSSQMRFAA